jgi:hypothetical protein
VDLQLTAQADGYSELLVVKTAEAAKSPDLAQLRFQLSTVGLQVKTDDTGALQMVDNATGGAVFAAPSAKMWDSTSGAAQTSIQRSAQTTINAAGAAMAPADGPQDGAKVADVKVAVGSGQLTLEPDQSLLTAPDTKFPVYIDPQPYTVHEAERLMVSDHAGNDYHFTGTEGVGFCDVSRYSPCGTDHKKRLFYRMPLSHYGGATIISAQFIAYETWASSCPNEQGSSIQLWLASGFAETSTWGTTADNWLKHLTSRDVAYCSDAGVPVKFPSVADGNDSSSKSEVTKAVADYVKAGKTAITFGLRAYSESSMDWWKRFKDDAALSVVYNHSPRQPKKANMIMFGAGGCGSKTSPVYTNELPTLLVKGGTSGVSDPDGDKVQAQFGLSWDASDGAGWKQRWQSDLSMFPSVASGTQVQLNLAKATSPAVTLPQKTPIGWHVRGYDGTVNGSSDYGLWSWQSGQGDCYFVYDTTIPAPPTITSSDYPKINPDDPDDPAGYGGVGDTGKFTLTSADAGKFRIGLNGDPSTAWEIAATNGSAVIDVTPPHDGTNTLSVQSVSRAGTPGQANGFYVFRVNPGTTPAGHWKLDDDAGSTQLADAAERTDITAHPVTAHGGVTLGQPGQVDTGMHLNGTTGYADTTGKVLDTSKSFSVSVWARLPATKPAGAAIIATQAGTHKSGFELYYSASYDKWVFNRYEADTDAAQPIRAMSQTTKAMAGTWAHLVGVYDSAANQVRLYVNGSLAGWAQYDKVNAWAANGKMQIGTGSYGAGPANFFPGDIDDVQVWDRVVYEDEVMAMYTVRPAVVGRWTLNTKITSSSPPTSADDTGAHPLSLQGGADISTAANVGTGALGLNSTSAYAATSGPVVDTPQSFTISAWAGTASRPHAPATVFSLPGANNSALAVRYVPDPADPDNLGHYEMAVSTSDAPDDPNVTKVTHSSWHADSDWDLLTVVYDAPNKTITLYVNGYPEGGTDVSDGSQYIGISLFDPTKSLQLGANTTNKGTRSEFWPGQIDDVWVFRGAASEDDVPKLYSANELDVDHPPI